MDKKVVQKSEQGRKRKSEIPDKKQGTLDVFKIGETNVFQVKLNALITKFIISTLSPVSIVENPTFVELLKCKAYIQKNF